MEFHYLYILSTILLLYLFLPSINCQQVYLNTTVTDCSDNPSAPKGYLCNGAKKSCTSFLVFRSKPPYDNPIRIAYLLGSEAFNIASINKISTNDMIPSNKSIIVPVFCSCSGNIYQHNTPYTVNKDDTYFMLVNGTYQSLTTCQALMGQNYYSADNIAIGAELTVPLLCACPTTNQTARGVTSLLVYSVTDGDTIKSIGEAYGVDELSMLEANGLPVPPSANSSMTIFAMTPILVPLRGKSCKEDPDSFYCTCSQGMLADGSSKGLNCDESAGQKFPVKLVASLGVGIGAGFLCLFLLGYRLYQYVQKRRESNRKETLFRQNGGYLLQEKLSSYGHGEKAKLFTAEELQRATDNYNQSRFLGQGGYGMVYKGMLPDGTIVAVKKSKEIERNQMETFVNEVVILSQINHRNIVKLIGCCLETETPLLVYEFIPNGTLSQHIHRKDHESSLPWENQISNILDARVVKEARKDDILAIANLAMRCLRLNGKKRPTMKEVSAELEALRKIQDSSQINSVHESAIDVESLKYPTSEAAQDSTEESFMLSLQVESTSF
ncbi:Serine-threonine/tyrosine-protein kinase, catalytic domain [Sesbania bispinosa]|nr:Serine-threonine/tyrosine-protein kinase, catalytic domain [Sesbania bispinosa]